MILLFSWVFQPSIIFASEKSITFFVDNMNCCGSLEPRISEILETIYGVIDFSTDGESQTVLIIYDDELTSLQEVVIELRKEGLQPEEP